jgi:cell division control protein 6
LDWVKKLDKATLDTLGRVSGVYLEEYGLPQLSDIISYRAEEAFQPGAVSEDLVDFIARIAMGYGGVRYGLELLLEAGGQAELGSSRTVKAEHVRKAHAMIPKGVNGAYYPRELSLHKMLLLKGIINALMASSEPYLSIDDSYSAYQVSCEDHSREPDEMLVVQSYLDELAADGYILIKTGDHGKFVGVEFPFDRLARALDEALKQALQA